MRHITKRKFVPYLIRHRQLHTPQQQPRRRSSLPSVDVAKPCPRGCPDVKAFQQTAFIPKKPLLFPKGAGSPITHLPVFPFARLATDEFLNWPFPYELMKSSRNQDSAFAFCEFLSASSDTTDQIMAGILRSALDENPNMEFYQTHAPYKLLIKALEFNQSRDPAVRDPLQLYIAQSPLSDLPQPLQNDIRAPELVRRTGKGDIYNSSIWLGTEPTYTPLHRDPNPNLFCQLWSRKVVRLLPPSTGDRLFFEVQEQVQQQGNSRIRTADMMQGKERPVLHDAIWENESPPDDMCEAELEAGDALFIPEGWWHSVKSMQSNGSLNASVNWWFR
ncbi:hypothetical protein E4U43_006238 [Claviceps pusilla]|uniref:JmjC domain-containing protein n=1 Tax=Claviceps pusilla TaxID=123648 RepID=A0A9P7T2B3_9HYPO|nr:hypothetical protein E4U43_006238 [Claviceps pusilla]